jgi:N-acetylglucosaminyl-diphospho-decaprenol L-rhamnosyltransferase
MVRDGLPPIAPGGAVLRFALPGLARGMEPVGADRTHILVLNYNGRNLLGECLPSVVEAAARSPLPCAVGVVDNGSTDGSLEVLERQWPGMHVWHEPNRGLASFNAVLSRLSEPVVLLLNNDVKLDPGAVGPLVAAIDDHPDALFAAPLCWDFDGTLYEGMRTRVRTRFGLVQGMCRVPGHEQVVGRPDLTAAAGPVLAVHRERFLGIGGYDPVYFPGRIEDLDLGFRGWMAGWKGYYVPASVAYHCGFGSFGPAFGQAGCDRLAARNSLIFAWKNLSGRRLAGHLAWVPIRMAHALARGRLAFAAALIEAVGRLGPVLAARRTMAVGRGSWSSRQEEFFERFRW